MAPQMLTFTGLLLITVATSLVLAIMGFIRSRVRGAYVFSLLMLAAVFYALGSVFEIRSQTVDELHFWLSFEYIGIATCGPLLLLLTYTLFSKPVPSYRIFSLLIFAVPLMILVIVWTNPIHYQYYSALELDRVGSFSIMRMSRGPWYWVNLVYMNLTLILAFILSIHRAITSPPAFRRQSLTIVIGSLVPWSGMLLYQLGLSPNGLDTAPIGIALGGVIFGWGIMRYDLLDLAPVAYERVFADMSDGVMVLDNKNRLVDFNPAMHTILPELSKKDIGQTVESFLSNHPALLNLMNQPHPAVTDLSLEQNGNLRYFEAELSDMNGKKGNRMGSILTMNDITSRVELMQKLALIAAQDELTGMSNRRSFHVAAIRELERSRRQGTPLSVIIFDLDHFKLVNDTWGHEAGDMVLKATASVCAGGLRGNDLLSRYGGEEFAILLPDVSPEGAAITAERLRLILEATEIIHDDHKLHITASFGVSGRDTPDGTELEKLIREADAALYQAKEAGRNCVRLLNRSAAP